MTLIRRLALTVVLATLVAAFVPVTLVPAAAAATHVRASVAPAAVAYPYHRGQCWQATATQVDFPSWRGGTVRCSAPHNWITFGVVALPDTLDNGYATGPVGSIPTAVQSAMLLACRPAFRATLSPYIPRLRGFATLGGEFWAEHSRITMAMYLPTRAQWLAGQRWVRCDLGILAVGSRWNSNETMRPLPSSLTSLGAQLQSNPAAMAACSSAASNAIAPYWPRARVAACSTHPRYRLYGIESIKLSTDEPYPGASVARTRALAACDTILPLRFKVAWTYWPNSFGWAGGRGSVECWASTVS